MNYLTACAALKYTLRAAATPQHFIKRAGMPSANASRVGSFVALAPQQGFTQVAIFRTGQSLPCPLAAKRALRLIATVMHLTPQRTCKLYMTAVQMPKTAMPPLRRQEASLQQSPPATLPRQ
jgi:hypothetical protein